MSLILLMFVWLIVSLFQFARCTPVRVTLPFGELVGEREHGVDRFLSVPFAQPPVGALRFRPPKPWTDGYLGGSLDARLLPPACPQQPFPPSNVNFQPGVSFNESCLFMAIYRPSNPSPTPRPFLMYFAVGGLTQCGIGQSNPLVYDGAKMLQRQSDVIVVVVQIRLGALGYLFNDGLVAEQGTDAGNYGSRDAIAAVEFVKTHGAAFGGSDRITVTGESAGGNVASSFQTIPAAKGLVAAIGAQSSTFGLAGAQLSPKKALSVGALVEQKLNCTSGTSKERLRCLRSISFDKIGVLVPNPDLPLNEVFNTTVFPMATPDAVRNGQLAGIPMLIGHNAFEFGNTCAKLAPHFGTPQLYEGAVKSFVSSMIATLVTPKQRDILIQKILAAFPPSSCGDNAAHACCQLFDEISVDFVIRCTQQRTAKQLPTVFRNLFHGGRGQCPIVDNPAAHTRDIPFFFGAQGADYQANVTPNPGCRWSNAERQMSDDMIGVWQSLALGKAPWTGAGVMNFQLSGSKLEPETTRSCDVWNEINDMVLGWSE